MNWETVRLGDIAEFSNGINFDKSAYSHGVKLIGVSNFGNRFSPDYDSLEEIKKEVVRSNDYLQDGDIVFVRSNGNKELVGRCMLVKNPESPVTYSGFCIRARLNNIKKYNPLFFNYLFKGADFRKAMTGTAVGANIQNLSQGRLSSCEVRVPNYEIQTRIADILSVYDDLIENNQKQIKLLEEAAQRFYKEWFVDLRFPGYVNTPITDGIPQGWEINEVKSVVSLLSGYAFKSGDFVEGGKYKIVTIKNVQVGSFDGENVNTIAEIPSKMPSHCILNDGDILLSLTGNVGRVCLVNGEDYLLNQRVAKLDSKYPAYAYCLFRNKDMFNIMNNLANGAAQQNLSPIRTENVRILIPNDSLIENFENVVSPMISKMLLLNKANSNLKQARDRLLPKLISGELEV